MLGAEGLPGEAEAGPEVIAIFREDAGSADRAEDLVEGGVGVLRQRQELVLIAEADAEAEGSAQAPVILGEAGPLLRAEAGVFCAEALREGAEAELVDGSVDAGAAAVGVAVDAEGEVSDPVDEAAGVAVRGSAVVAEGPGGV